MAADASGSTLLAIVRQQGPSSEEAHEALKQKDYERARDLYGKLLEGGGYPASEVSELLYGLALAEHQITDYDGSVRHFSDVLHTENKELRTRAHRGLGHTLYDQGARGLSKQPKITLQRWMDALKHFDAAMELEPNQKELRENRDHVARMLEELRKALDAMQKQQQGQGQKGQKGQKGDQGQQGQPSEDQEGAEGKDGQQSGDSPEGEAQKSKQTGEQKGNDDGIGGKDAKNLPQGRLQAAGGRDGEKKDSQSQGGEGEEKNEAGKDGEPKRQEVAGGEKKEGREAELQGRRNAATGYTPGEAEGLLRQYMDEITGIPVGNRQNIPPPNKKDW
ncbi:MAG: hypothetical protein ACKO8Z_10885 [Prosthecobacter sp.]